MSTKTLQIEFEDTLKTSIKSQFNLFVGSGFSLEARNVDLRSLPTGEELRKELIAEFSLTSFSGISLPQLCTIIDSRDHDKLRSFLINRFTVKDFDSAYGVIARAPISAIFTTNIDNLIPLIFDGSQEHYLNDITRNGAAFADKTAVDFIPLHGSVLHEGNFVFNPSDLAAAFSSDRDKWHLLTSRLQKYPTIFCGYSLQDAGVLEALNPISINSREHKDKWILLRDPDDATSSYFRALGFKLIFGTTKQLLDWLNVNVLSALAPEGATTKSNHPALHEYRIPNAASLPVRPLKDFYLGAAPSWGDVLSGRIFRTSHYASVVNAINSGEHTLVLGMFASGKTTLMMQIAAELNFLGNLCAGSCFLIGEADVADFQRSRSEIARNSCPPARFS